ncbi:hypothetical protein AFLA_005411 [Aspergillus flavus NRRL3357]|nr:hypothetical protein AFLA_005411 [Aspergillus flavus NRRL3357]
MTRQGTVVFNLPGHAWFVVDSPGLATGRITIVDFGSSGSYNEPLDMDLPILDLLESTRQSNLFLHPAYCSRSNWDVWARIIEQSVPGYLELEEQGWEVEFELDHLLEIE